MRDMAENSKILALIAPFLQADVRYCTQFMTDA